MWGLLGGLGRVLGLGFRVQGLGLGDQGLACKPQDVRSRVWGLGLRSPAEGIMGLHK